VCAQHGHVVNGVQVPCGNTKHENAETTTRGQARKGDRPREGRLWECPKGRHSGNLRNAQSPRRDGAQRSQNRELMDKNRIEGRHGATSWHNTAKLIGMPVEVNPAAVRWSNVPLPGEISRASAPEKSAEVIVVGTTSRGRDARANNDTGGLNR
jgi:hypothetical protein